MPAGLQQELAGYDLSQKVIVFFLVCMLTPLFLNHPTYDSVCYRCG
jgi:hypothetical protein